MNPRRALIIMVGLALVACSNPPSHEQVVATTETAALAPLRDEYDGAVVGFIIKGSQLDVSIDLNAYSTMDEDDVPRLQAEVLRRWRGAWMAQHPRAHADLTVRFVDYHGRPFLIRTLSI